MENEKNAVVINCFLCKYQSSKHKLFKEHLISSGHMKNEVGFYGALSNVFLKDLEHEYNKNAGWNLNLDSVRKQRDNAPLEFLFAEYLSDESSERKNTKKRKRDSYIPDVQKKRKIDLEFKMDSEFDEKTAWCPRASFSKEIKSAN